MCVCVWGGWGGVVCGSHVQCNMYFMIFNVVVSSAEALGIISEAADRTNDRIKELVWSSQKLVIFT